MQPRSLAAEEITLSKIGSNLTGRLSFLLNTDDGQFGQMISVLCWKKVAA